MQFLGWEDPLEKGKGYSLQYCGLESPESMNVVKFQDIKLIHRNPLHSYTLTMRKQKEKLRKQFHSPLQ